MLRIAVAETATEQRWTVEARFVEPRVAELRTNWKNRHRAQNRRTCTIDLRAATFLDRGGQRLLRAMSKEDPRLVATNIYIKRVLDQWKPNGKRRLLKFISCLLAEPDVSVR
jgi:hypothetical protein